MQNCAFLSQKKLANALLASLNLLLCTAPVAAQADGESLTQHEWMEQYQRPSSIPFPEENPYTPLKSELGKMLFFDPRLSRSNNISCATCHTPSFSWGDGLALSIGDQGKELHRRSPTLLNLAWSDLLMWDGRAESLEEQALGPLKSSDEMNQSVEEVLAELGEIDDYQTLFQAAFPEQGLSAETLSQAIATFERTIVSSIAPFDRWIAGDESAISEAAKRGFDTFNNKARCVECHSSWNFTDGSFHDIGLKTQDVGLGKFFADIPTLQHAFKTPTLRNAKERTPFMHNGSIKDLKAAVEHYNNGFLQRPSLSSEIQPLNLSDREIEDLVAFLTTLSSRDREITVPVLPN